jgi:UDP:flavonoid glycosyltransferase YjiC (YdhE family)
MKVALVAVGSRGDVEPYIALGGRLVARGHSVRVAALEPFGEAVAGAGLAFHSLGDLPRRFEPRAAPDSRDASTLFRGVAGRALFWALYSGMLRAPLDRFISACEGMDAVLFTRLALPVPHVAERLDIPCFAGYPVPHTPTAAFENPLYVRTGRASSPRRNRATYAIEWGLTHQLSYRALMRFRRQRLGLQRVPRRALRRHMAQIVRGTLYAYSESVLPRPADWPAHVQVTGYWTRELPSAFVPPADVQAFLDRGAPPACVGFGSMKSSDPRRLGAAIGAALAAVGLRAIVQSGWSRLDLSGIDGDRVLVTSDVPHAWLLPRAAVAIHHGGAGTTAAALAAGLPSVIVPHAFDQRFWGRRIAALGCGPEPIEHRDLSADALATALRSALAPEGARAAAARLGERLRAEDGTGRAAELLERWMEEPA